MLGGESSGPGLGSGRGSGRWVGRKPGKERVSFSGGLDLGVPAPLHPPFSMGLEQPLWRQHPPPPEASSPMGDRGVEGGARGWLRDTRGGSWPRGLVL